MSEQFGFWFACVVLIAVVAGGCEDKSPEDWVVDHIEETVIESVEKPASLDYEDEQEFRDLHARIHAEEEYEERATAKCEKAFGKGWKPGRGMIEQDDPTSFVYFTQPSCEFRDEKTLPDESEAAK